MNSREMQLRRRVAWCAWIVMGGLVLSGVTAIPLAPELDVLARIVGAANLSSEQAGSGFVRWVLIVRDGLHVTYARYPFIAYGTDWLAFAHIVLAIAFLGAWRHPLRNLWLFRFGMIACGLVVPWALIFGELRGIPVGWRLIDCAFGVVGFIPCWIAFRSAKELEQRRAVRTAATE